MPDTTERPKFTSDTAKSFDGISEASAMQVYAAIEARAAEGVYPDCECEPYAQVYTFNRWRAQGYAVKKGEKALRIDTWVRRGGKTKGLPDDMPDAEREKLGSVRLRPKTVFLFCQCQVRPLTEGIDG